MRLILKEKKTLKEVEDPSSVSSKEFNVLIKPQDFLNLTPPDPTIKARAQYIGDFDIKKAEGMFLGINPETGEVIEHGGRARAQAAKTQGKYEKIPIVIKLATGYGSMTWGSLPKTFTQQEGGSNTVQKNQLELVGIPQDEPRTYRVKMKKGDSWILLGMLYNPQAIRNAFGNTGMPEGRKILKPKPGAKPSSRELNDFEELSDEEVSKIMNG
jgi:hypothetical protein